MCMLQKWPFLVLGIVALSFSFVLFSGQQYFSPYAMAGLLLLGLIAGLLFLYPHHNMKGSMTINIAIIATLVVIALLVFYGYAFDLPPPGSILSAVGPVFYVSLATVVTIAGLFVLGKVMHKNEGAMLLLCLLAGIVVISLLAYSCMYVINKTSWLGVDETAYNYYAAVLLSHGENPYTNSMQPIIAQLGVTPTVEINGSYEYAYSYPALSFLPFVLLPLLGITSFYSFVFVAVLLAAAASVFIYYKSGYSNAVLLPIAAWSFASYMLIGVVSPLLAVSVLMLLAYLYRSKAAASGIFMGLAASTTQLAWFMIPFLLVLSYRERGMRQAGKIVAYGLLAFAIVNGYFIIASPQGFASVLGLFGTSKLSLYGPNLMQFAAAFYALPSWYSAAISAIVLVSLLALYYLYTDRLRALIAVAPMLIFFIAWRNIEIYGLSFIPILIAVYFTATHERLSDIAKSKAIMLAVPPALFALALVVAVAAHYTYLTGPHIEIEKVLPIISVQSGAQGPEFGLIGMRVIVNNTFDKPENVSFSIVSRSPNSAGYALAPSLNATPAISTYNYTLTYALPLVNNRTEISVTLFNPDYTYTRTINFTNLGTGAPGT